MNEETLLKEKLKNIKRREILFSPSFKIRGNFFAEGIFMDKNGDLYLLVLDKTIGRGDSILLANNPNAPRYIKSALKTIESKSN